MAARFKELLDKVAEGDASPLDDGQLFRSIRGIQTKLDMVENTVAMESLTGFIRQSAHSNSALKVIAQAAANTDGQAAASKSEYVCRKITEVPGLMGAVVLKMKSDVDAVRLVNNLAANSELSALSFVHEYRSLEALRVACVKFKLHAFGVINHLSRCKPAAQALVNDGFVADVLVPSIEESFGATVEQEATLARGTLALANLSSSNFPSHLRMPENPTILATIVKVLHHAARGIRLASITWLPPSVLFGIRNMTGDDKVCRLLVDSGLAFVLAGIILETCEWDEECGESTLGLSIDVVDNLSRQSSVVQDLWDGGIVASLRSLSDPKRGVPSAYQVRADALIDRLLERHTAVLMGGDRWLGDKSMMCILDDSVLCMILKEAFGGDEGVIREQGLSSVLEKVTGREGVHAVTDRSG